MDESGSRFNGFSTEVTISCHIFHLIESLFASLAVSLSMRMSPTFTGPITFLAMILPWSRPDRTLTLTAAASLSIVDYGKNDEAYKQIVSQLAEIKK